MGKLKGIPKLIRRMDIGKMCERAKEVSKQSQHPYLLTMFDMAYCGLKYGAGYSDYALFHMWDMNQSQRKTVLTRGINNQYVATFNQKEFWSYFDNKPLFLETFSQFAGREWLDLEKANADEFGGFLQKHGSAMLKLTAGTHGDGVQRIIYEPNIDVATVYQTALSNGQTLCEEVLKQDASVNEIWSGSINTVRALTLLHENIVHVLAVYMRIGNNSKNPVDNFNNNGIVVPLDKETGVISDHAVDKKGTIYTAHPATGAVLKGRQLPYWTQVLELLEQAGKVVPQVAYVAWDIGLTPDGPVLVEGNQYPGHDYLQLPAHTTDKIGMLPVWERVYTLK